MQPFHLEFKRHLVMGGKAALRIPIVTKNAPITFTSLIDDELSSVKCDSIRISFYNLLRKNQQQIENEFAVKCSLEKNDKNVSLMIHGKNSHHAMRKSLQLCLESKIYNFYLCLPIGGKAFEMELEDFKTKYEDKLAGGKWESRPHVTLKMLNIVTNKHLAYTINILNNITKQIQDKFSLKEPIQLELSSLNVFEEKTKNTNIPLFSSTTLTHPIDEISKQLIDSTSSKYNFKNEVIKQYKSSNDSDEEDQMTIEDYSLYIHTFDAKNDSIASSKRTIKENNYESDNLELQNNDDSELPQSPHVTLIRYNNFKEAIGLQGPKTGLVNTCELRPRHGETTWPYEQIGDDDCLAFSYNLLQNNNDNELVN